jgi:hypothetical protein
MRSQDAYKGRVMKGKKLYVIPITTAKEVEVRVVL